MEQIIGMKAENGLEDLVSYLRHFPPNLSEGKLASVNVNSGARLRSLCHTLGKADFIAPSKNPQNIYEITEADYLQLFTTVEEQAAQRQIIWEFGPMLTGMFRWMNHCQEIYCPYQDEVLHRWRRERLEQIMELHQQSELLSKLRYIKLPQIYWLPGEVPDVSQLLYGAFGDSVRKQVTGHRP